MKVKILIPLRDEVGNPLKREEVVPLSVLKYLLVRFGWGVFWKYGKLSPLWQTPSPLWIIYCPRHKFVVTYRLGFDSRLDCLFCLRETPQALYCNS